MALQPHATPAIEHALVIEPLFAADQDQELRLESICVAAGEAKLLKAQTE